MKVITTEMNSKRVIETRKPYNDARISTRREYHTLKIYVPHIGAGSSKKQESSRKTSTFALWASFAYLPLCILLRMLHLFLANLNHK